MYIRIDEKVSDCEKIGQKFYRLIKLPGLGAILEKRTEALEERFSPMEKEQIEPIGQVLGCGPEVFIDWFDYCLHPDSKCHELDFRTKYEITVDICYLLRL